MDERRKYSRLRFSADATLEVEGRTQPTHLFDLSVKGAMVEMPGDGEVTPGQRGKLRIHLQDSDITMEMEVEVTRATEDRLGLRYASIDVDSLTHLRRLLELNLGDPALVERELSELG